MSSVTNVLLTCSCEESEGYPEQIGPIRLINAWLELHHHRALRCINDGAGGEKQLETFVFAGAFNYLATVALRQFIGSLAWAEPEHVQLFVQEDHEDRFTVYDLASAPTGE